MADKSITVIETTEVQFYEDEITAVLVDVEGAEDEDERVYVALRPITDRFGLDWSAQTRRIRRDLVLAEEVATVAVTATDGRRREMLCLPLKFLSGFLFGINASRVKEEARAGLILYQRECYSVLQKHFRQKYASEAEDVAITPAMRQLMQIKDMAQAIMQMAEEQIEHEKRIARTEQRLDAAAAFVKGMDNRLRAVERRVSPGNPISDEQAGEVADLVRSIATSMAERDDSKNHYQSIWAELRRRFKVSSYKLIPQERFAAVMAFLREQDELCN